MSLYPNVTEPDMINLDKLAMQQRKEITGKINNKILERTHKKLAESFKPRPEKVEEADKSTKILKKVFEIANSETENQQEIVPVEIDSINSEDANDDIPSYLRTLAKNLSMAMKKNFSFGNEKSQFFRNRSRRHG